MVGYEAGVDPDAVRPFDPERFPDEPSRQAMIDRLARDGTVRDLLLRIDGSTGRCSGSRSRGAGSRRRSLTR